MLSCSMRLGHHPCSAISKPSPHWPSQEKAHSVATGIEVPKTPGGTRPSKLLVFNQIRTLCFSRPIQIVLFPHRYSVRNKWCPLPVFTEDSRHPAKTCWEARWEE